jgi:hypothetical protein
LIEFPTISSYIGSIAQDRCIGCFATCCSVRIGACINDARSPPPGQQGG